nr:hypothetical protein [Tanacetum cinerariifolium]
MVINSPCLTDKKELAIPGQTTTGKEFSNPLMAGSLPKTINLKFVDQHNMVAYLEKSDDNTEFHQIMDFLSSCSINYALTVSPTIYASYIEQFWNTASSKTINSVKQIHDIADGKAVVISESSVRSDLLFDDEDGGGDSVERAITTDASLEAAQDSDNIHKTQNTAMPNVDIPQGMDTGGSPRRQETMGGTPAQTRSERVLEQSNEPPLSEDEEEPSLDIEDSPKQGRMIEEINKDENVNFVSKQGEVLETAEPLKDDDDDATLAETLLNIKRSTTKDKGKDILEEDVDKGDQTQEIDWNDPKVIRYHALQNRVFYKAEDQNHNFVPKDSKIEKEVMKRSRFDLQQESSKKRKLDEQTEEEVEAQVDSDQEVEEIKLYMRRVPDEEIAIDAIPLATKPLVIVEYKIVKEGKISTYYIIRSDGSTKRYTSMINLLENINREDLETL